jgi:hypothetical protein
MWLNLVAGMVWKNLVSEVIWSKIFQRAGSSLYFRIQVLVYEVNIPQYLLPIPSLYLGFKRAITRFVL